MGIEQTAAHHVATTLGHNLYIRADYRERAADVAAVAVSDLGGRYAEYIVESRDFDGNVVWDVMVPFNSWYDANAAANLLNQPGWKRLHQHITTARRYLERREAGLTGLELWCDSCEHITGPTSEVASAYQETDSFGPVVRALICPECDEFELPGVCEWCNHPSASVHSRRSWNSGDYYYICSACHAAENRPQPEDYE